MRPEPIDPAALHVTVLRGGDQSAAAGEVLADSLVVRVTADGEAVDRATLLWRAGSGGAGEAMPPATPLVRGRAATAWRAGTRAGAHVVHLRAVVAGDTVLVDSIALRVRPGPPVRATLDSPAADTLAVGETTTVRARGADAHGNEIAPDSLRLAWTSSVPGVATVDSAGVVTARAPGRASISAPLPEGTVAAEIVVRSGDGGSTAVLQRIAFGSCNRQDLPQPLWAPIAADDPDLWIWLGDNIYGDTDDMSVLAAKYTQQRANAGYRDLLARVPVIGTWDDHDYGRNNAGREYPYRAASQQVFLDFLDVPQASPRRTREGVYASHTYGPAGQRVKVILLDVRYHREYPGATADVLGEAQWAWLEAELRNSDAQVNLVASGIQFVPEEHRFEKWANFPQARARLFSLIRDSGAPGVVLLSGDRHFAEISRIDGAAAYPLYEVTSSGLTHSWTDVVEANRFRVGELYPHLHYGMMEIEWAPAPRLRLQIRDRDGVVRREQVVALSDLQPR